MKWNRLIVLTILTFLAGCGSDCNPSFPQDPGYDPIEIGPDSLWLNAYGVVKGEVTTTGGASLPGAQILLCAPRTSGGRIYPFAAHFGSTPAPAWTDSSGCYRINYFGHVDSTITGSYHIPILCAFRVGSIQVSDSDMLPLPRPGAPTDMPVVDFRLEVPDSLLVALR
jgi:hypothetical protein